MNMEHAEYIKLQSQLQDHFDGRYVLAEECEKQIEKEESKIDKIYKDITQMRQDFSSMRVERAKDSTKLSVVIGILCAIAVPLVSLCVKLLFGS